MSTPRMQAAVVGSGDSPGSVPRYLLPISQSTNEDSLIVNNRVYQQHFRNLTGQPFPTIGFRKVRQQLNGDILNYLGYVKPIKSFISSAMSLHVRLQEHLFVCVLAILSAFYVSSMIPI